MKCPLCGFEFSREEMECRECPLGASQCKVVCCPSCDYRFVEARSKTVDMFKKVFKRRKDLERGED